MGIITRSPLLRFFIFYFFLCCENYFLNMFAVISVKAEQLSITPGNLL